MDHQQEFKVRTTIADYYIKNVQSSAKELEQIDLAIKKYNQCLTYCRQNGEDLAAIQLKQVIAAHPTFLKAEAYAYSKENGLLPSGV